MEKKAKKELPGASIGLYICAGIMFVLLALSVVGIFIGREDGTWPYFIGAALITLVMAITCLLSAKWFQERGVKKPKFASYAFTGEFAPQKKQPAQQPQKQTAGKTRSKH